MVRLTDRPDMTLDVYPGRKTTIQQQYNNNNQNNPKYLDRSTWAKNAEPDQIATLLRNGLNRVLQYF